MKKFNEKQLKYLAAIFMFVSHVYSMIGKISPIFKLVSAFVVPLFAFFIVEDFFTTKKRWKYAGILWLAAIIMQLGNVASFFIFGAQHFIRENIFLTFALGFTLLCVLDKRLRTEDTKRAKFFFMALFIFTLSIVWGVAEITIGDYTIPLYAGYVIVPMMFFFYHYHGNRKKQVISFFIWNIIVCVLLGGLFIPQDFDSKREWFRAVCEGSESYAFLFFPVLFLYNGERQEETPKKRWFLYVLYPLHMWILAIISNFV